MLYQTIWMAYYDSNNLIKWPFKNFAKQMLIDIITFVLMYIISNVFVLKTLSYIGWILLAIEVSIVGLIVVILINCIFYKKYINMFYKSIKSKISN